MISHSIAFHFEMTRRYFCYFDEGDTFRLSGAKSQNTIQDGSLTINDFSCHCIPFRNDKDVFKMAKVKRIRELICFQLKGRAIKNSISKIPNPVTQIYIFGVFTNFNNHW